MFAIKAMPALFKSALFSVLLLSFFSFTVKAQIFRINTINCKLSNADTALLNKMGRFEGNFYNQVFETHLNDTVVININLYGKHGEYKKVVSSLSFFRTSEWQQLYSDCDKSNNCHEHDSRSISHDDDEDLECSSRSRAWQYY